MNIMTRLVIKAIAVLFVMFLAIQLFRPARTNPPVDPARTLEAHVDPSGHTDERPLLFACITSHFESGVDNPLDAAVLAKTRKDPLDSAVLRHPHGDISGYRKVDEIPFDFERRRVSVVVERDGERLAYTFWERTLQGLRKPQGLRSPNPGDER